MKSTTFIIDGPTIDQIISNLQQQFILSAMPDETYRIHYIDTFSWSLFKKGQSLYREQRNRQSRLVLAQLPNDDELAIINRPDSFNFVDELPDHTLRDRIKCPRERALVTQLSLDCHARQWHILNKDEKTVARLVFNDCRANDRRNQHRSAQLRTLTLYAVKGYEKKTEKVDSVIRQIQGISTWQHTFIELVLQSLGRSTNEHDSKIRIALSNDMDAASALRMILLRLLDIMQQNEHGILQEIDSEFLHDYRIAVRKTRSVIGTVKDVFDSNIMQRFKTDFAWLGSVTGPARDLDVHMLEFEEYCKQLPAPMNVDILPVNSLMKSERDSAYVALKKALKSQRYHRLKTDWTSFLQNGQDGGHLPGETLSILDVSGKTIWRIYRDTLHKGARLNADSAAEDFHAERKICKKLRYLLELFTPLYPQKDLSRMIKALKDIQDQLGEFQDLDVQESLYHHYADMLMLRDDTCSGTLLALGVLIERLDQRRQQIMTEFARHFQSFSDERNRQLFRTFFKPEGKQVET